MVISSYSYRSDLIGIIIADNSYALMKLKRYCLWQPWPRTLVGAGRGCKGKVELFSMQLNE
jgi:hypothetical protein